MVVGAGIVGASVAYRAARAGAVVTLVDVGRPGAGRISTVSRAGPWIADSARFSQEGFGLRNGTELRSRGAPGLHPGRGSAGRFVWTVCLRTVSMPRTSTGGYRLRRCCTRTVRPEPGGQVRPVCAAAPVRVPGRARLTGVPPVTKTPGSLMAVRRADSASSVSGASGRRPCVVGSGGGPRRRGRVTARRWVGSRRVVVRCPVRCRPPRR